MPSSARMQAAISRAASASNAERIDHRDDVAAFGPEIVEPLLGWVRDGTHAHFVIRVFEALGRSHLAAALAALSEATRLDRSLATEVEAARQRLLGRTTKPAPPSSARPRDTGVLDQVTRFGRPVESGDCMGITQKGEPCRNPGRYWVGDKLSCSRRHAQYR